MNNALPHSARLSPESLLFGLKEGDNVCMAVPTRVVYRGT